MDKRFKGYQFLDRANKIHGDYYDYSLTEYKLSKQKVKIICPEHGVFEQTPDGHLSGKGCKRCGVERALIKFKDNIRKLNQQTDLSKVSLPEKSKAIPLTSGGYAIVDEEDYEKVMQYNWSYSGLAAGDYIQAFENYQKILLHRYVMGVTDRKLQVDHIFHLTFDNRKSQLRVCNQQQNSCNTRPQKDRSSKYKGVCKPKSKNKWRAEIYCKGERTYLGYFVKEEEAARVYDEKAKELFGAFAYLNFPDEK